ncbi:MAG: type II secretion system F family protein [Acetobacteraceae bacterium]
MTGSLPWFLLIMSCLSLAGLGFSGYLVSRAQAFRQKRDARLAAVLTPHIRTQKLEISAFTRATKPRDQSLEGMASLVFGFDAATPDRYPLRWWVVVVIALAIAKAAHSLVADLAGVMAWLVIPLVWIGLSRAFFGFFDRRLREQLLAQFPDALAMIVRSVRVGIPVQESIRTVAREIPAPTGVEFARLVSQVSVGVSMEDAMTDMARRAGLPEYRFFATALSLQTQTGGALSETLENLADVIRKRAALKAKGMAMTSEAKTTAGILAGLPVVLGLLLWALNPAYIGLLFTDPTGRNLFGAAVVSLITGLFVIRTIIRRSLPA